MTISERLFGVEKDITEIRKDVDSKVERIEFEPVKTVVFGLVGLILITVVGWILSNAK